MIEKLGFKKRTHVGISLSSSNFIELVCIDKETKSVIKYATGNVKYNNAIKEIIDFEEFSEVVSSLFDDADLNPSDCAVTLNIPNVHFDITALENETEDTYIRESLLSDIEDLYIFKKNEPQIEYIELNANQNRTQKVIAYSAIQTKILNRIIEVFDNIGADLVRIETSYTSMLKAIEYTDRFQEYVQPEERTTILLITSSSCSTFYLNGNNLVNYNEEPLAIKSFSPEEVYMTIAKIAENTIKENLPKSLLILSETDDVNAELLSQKIEFSGQMEYINNSLNLNDSIIDIVTEGLDIDSNNIDSNNASYITIEAVGAAVADFGSFPMDINFLPPERVNNNIVQVGPYEVDFYRFLVVLLGGSLLLAFIIGILIRFVLDTQINSLDTDRIRSNNEVKVFRETIEKNENASQNDILPKLTEILDNNKKLVEIYASLSVDIPESIYIKRFVTGENGGIGILGEAKTSESVEKFVNRLREKNNLLMLSRLQVNTKYDPVPAKIPNGFTFEIKTNGKDVSLSDDNTLPNGTNDIQNAISPITNGGNIPTPTNATQLPPSPII